MDPYPVLPEFDEIPFVVKSEGYEWPAEAILTQEQEKEFLHVLFAEKKARRERQGMKYKKRGNPDPPGFTLCSAESLDKLRTEFEVPNEVEFSLPRSSDRADDPPLGYFTMYENSIEECFLTFPIPPVILDYFWTHKVALAQATPRGPSGFPPCPDGLFTDFLSANLAAGVKTNPAGGQEGGVQDQPIVSGEVSEVSQEKLKKSKRTKRPPRVPVPDGVIPSSDAGASASGTALEQDEESARRRKKRSRRSSSVGRVPSLVRAVLTDGISESVIDDSKTAAWFANIQYHGNDGPLPAELVADPDFGLMSRHGSRHFATANRLAWKLYDRGELSRKSCSDAQTRLGIEMDHRKSVESKLQTYQRRCVEAEERAIEENAKASTLQQQLTEEKTGITSKIKRATKAAMRTFTTKFQGKIDRAKEKIKALGGNPKTKLVQLAQVEANIEFARILREAPDSFDAEVAKVEAWLPNVAGGDVEFDSLFAGLDSDLVISPISSDSSGAARDNVSLETLAADVGVRAFDGSMTDELGVNHDDDEYVNIDD
ncbi:hypothetical protein AALP_AAs55070U000100 [Arabis alpina]|uniref:Uncharacterized protein n=1 Tax=Arabis alpina TaxID=50452 RepID=A0A087G0U5_ARAAL|nr:hypothetical protein AALP_AAs55070U000100 [Arabis alpina]